MAEMITEAVVLTRQASAFDGIAQGLIQERSTVDNIGLGFQSQWQGQAATATTAALQRFDSAMQAQINELKEIVEKLNRSGGNYTNTDEEACQLLSSKMNF
ncbi:WXG100 family type VII secretion target [Mycobacterium lepromatosis]|uniref:ESAT-6-like protein n=1 Tax=Mycobacterium lepromatosis TaxID=480418 RepID=A0A0F4ESY4_9MYCO|nr:WXG100 family type VII secretion target [Mycobacterium lepromatosis]KJX75913.1 EsxB [Mycobacterium lepromatosis]UKN41443.1 ESAT-6-like protein EsxB [Mycobacterium lepromatosis]